MTVLLDTPDRLVDELVEGIRIRALEAAEDGAWNYDSDEVPDAAAAIDSFGDHAMINTLSAVQRGILLDRVEAGLKLDTAVAAPSVDAGAFHPPASN